MLMNATLLTYVIIMEHVSTTTVHMSVNALMAGKGNIVKMVKIAIKKVIYMV